MYLQASGGSLCWFSAALFLWSLHTGQLSGAGVPLRPLLFPHTERVKEDKWRPSHRATCLTSTFSVRARIKTMHAFYPSIGLIGEEIHFCCPCSPWTPSPGEKCGIKSPLSASAASSQGTTLCKLVKCETHQIMLELVSFYGCHGNVCVVQHVQLIMTQRHYCIHEETRGIFFELQCRNSYAMLLFHTTSLYDVVTSLMLRCELMGLAQGDCCFREIPGRPAVQHLTPAEQRSQDHSTAVC